MKFLTTFPAVLLAGFTALVVSAAEPPTRESLERSTTKPVVTGKPVTAGAIRRGLFAEFVYDPATVYSIQTAVGTHVTLALAEGERVLGKIYHIDAASFRIEITNDLNAIMIAALAESSTTLSFRTNFGRYELVLSTVPASDRVQHVRWLHPAREQEKALAEAREAEQHRAATTLTTAEAKRLDAAIKLAEARQGGVDPAKANANYRIEGDAPFKPVKVMDDGTETFFVLPSGLEFFPAIFAVTGDSYEFLNMEAREGYLVVPRVAQQFRLRYGEKEVRVVSALQAPEPKGILARLFGDR